jgi:hypothetical protein
VQEPPLCLLVYTASKAGRKVVKGLGGEAAPVEGPEIGPRRQTEMDGRKVQIRRAQ